MILLGIIQSLTGFLIFLFRKPKHISNTILAIWLLTLAIVLAGGMVEGGVVQYFKPGVFPLVFLFGPLLYFYIHTQISDSFGFEPRHLLHLLPMLMVVLHRLFSHPENIGFEEAGAQNIANSIYQVMMVISLIIYWILGINLLIQHRKNIPDNFSYQSERLTLNWTWIIVFLNILIFIVSFLTPFIRVDYEWARTEDIFYFNFVLFSFLLLIFGLMQPVIYTSDVHFVEEGKGTKKYQRSGLETKDKKEIAALIVGYFNTQKSWLNPEFDLQKMAADLNLSRQNISQVINEELNKNFYRLVNEYRVNEVKQKMSDPGFSHLSLLGIGLESGFNSKASFNRVFKEIAGQTPSQYKAKIISD